MDCFNKNFSRINTGCYKWDFDCDDILPFSIADSDYQTAQPIIDALIKRVEHGAFGYTKIDDEYRRIIKNWVNKRYNYTIELDWIIPTTGVVCALYYIINCLTKENDKILIQPPVYNQFYSVICDSNRKVVTNNLINNNEIYEIDFLDLEEQFKSGVKLFILCSPHNPVGRVWNKNEIERVVDLCIKYHVTLVSDEIHCDIILKDNQFTSIGCYQHKGLDLVICTAPSKTFNIAGLHISNLVVSNKDMREKIESLIQAMHVCPDLLSITACKAAYLEGESWLEYQNNFLTTEFQFLKTYLNNEIKEAKLADIQGTYLAWIDLRFLGLSSCEICTELLDYGIAVAPGKMYGEEYDGYIRFNFACSNKQLKKGLEILKKYIEDKKVSKKNVK